MNVTLLGSFKQVLTIMGSRLSERSLHRFQMVVNYMKLGRWMSAHDFRFDRRVRDRSAVFATVAERVRDQPVLYLEFGVFQGASMRYWSRALKHPESVLHGRAGSTRFYRPTLCPSTMCSSLTWMRISIRRPSTFCATCVRGSDRALSSTSTTCLARSTNPRPLTSS